MEDKMVELDGSGCCSSSLSIKLWL